MSNTPLVSIAGLIKNGLTLAEVEQMDDSELLAWQVAFGTADGGRFDWSNLQWRERS